MVSLNCMVSSNKYFTINYSMKTKNDLCSSKQHNRMTLSLWSSNIMSYQYDNYINEIIEKTNSLIKFDDVQAICSS